MKLVPAVKIGRCFNGFERDKGSIVHYVPPIDHYGDWFDKAICGAKPGLRGNGWGKTDKAVNCPKCLKKKEKINSES